MNRDSAASPSTSAARATGARCRRRASPRGGPGAGSDARRACDGLDEHAFERALPQLAEQQPQQKILLVGRGAAEQVAKQPGPRRSRPGAAGCGDAIEGGVDVANLERRSIGRRDVAGR